MTKQHPITPPPELVEQLCNSPDNWRQQLTNAYQAGADQGVEACCEWLYMNGYNHVISARLRDALRPKPPTLKEQALAELEEIMDLALNYTELHGETGSALTASAIRRALEQLDD